MDFPAFQQTLRDALADAEAGRSAPLAGDAICPTGDDAALARHVATLTAQRRGGEMVAPHDWRMVPPCF